MRVRDDGAAWLKGTQTGRENRKVCSFISCWREAVGDLRRKEKCSQTFLSSHDASGSTCLLDGMSDSILWHTFENGCGREG